MQNESERVQESFRKDEAVEAYGFEWLVSDVDHKGRYTLTFEQWAIYGVEPILVRRASRKRG
jgi:hypothetical protein